MLEKIESLYLFILRYVIVVTATLAVISSLIFLFSGFEKSLTGDPSLPTENYNQLEKSNELSSYSIISNWIPEGSERDSLIEFDKNNNIKQNYNFDKNDNESFDELSNKFLTNSFGVSYTNKSYITDTAIFGDNSYGVEWYTRWENSDSTGTDNLNQLWNSMLRDHLRMLNAYSAWFSSLSEDRKSVYKDFLLESFGDTDTPRFIAQFNANFNDWLNEKGVEYDNDLSEAELTRAQASADYMASLSAFAVFLLVMFMSLVAFIESSVRKISNK